MGHINIKRIHLLALFVLLQITAGGQSVQKVRLKEYHKHSGNLFLEEYKPWFDIKDLKTRYTPSLGEICLAEKIFVNKYNQYILSDSAVTAFRPIENPRKFFRGWARNYLGFVNEDGERIIIMHLINFNNKKQALDVYTYWGKELLVGFGDWYEKNQKFLYINLDQLIIEER